MKAAPDLFCSSNPPDTHPVPSEAIDQLLRAEGQFRTKPGSVREITAQDAT